MNNLKKILLLSPLLLVACSGASLGGGGGGNGGGLASDGLPYLIIASAIVDVNADGKNDIIISNGQSIDGDTAPLLYINQGNSSTFVRKVGAMPSQYNGKYASAVDIKPGDYNNDGKVDLLLITVAENYQTSKIQLFLGAGDGTFSDGTSKITKASWPDTSFACSSAPNSNNAGALYLRVVDVDGDSHSDFVLSFGGIGTCGGIIYRNDGSGNFAPASMTITDGSSSTKTSLVDAGGGYSTEVLDGDLNGDGKVDFFAPRPNSSQAAFINTSTPGNISFTVVKSNFMSGALHGALLDIDGDNKLDFVGTLAYMGPTYEIAVAVNAYKGNGLGGFTLNNSLFTEQPSVQFLRQLLVADLDNDSRKDLLLLNSGPDLSPFPGEKSWLFLNNGQGKLANKTSTHFTLATPYTHQGAVGDLNGDGSPDLFINNSLQSLMTAQKVSRIWFNNGSGVFTSGSLTFQ